MTPGELLGPLNAVEHQNAPERLYIAGDVELLRCECAESGAMRI
jgi:hypothetical protein